MAKDAAPTCECGRKAVREGAWWVCRTPTCDGHGQVLREVRE